MIQTKFSTPSVLLIVLGLTGTSHVRAQASDAPPEVSPPGPAPSYAPPPPPRSPPPFSASPAYRQDNAFEVRFEPDDPAVQLLTLSGETPVEQVAYVHRGWWHPHGYYYGYGVAHVYAPLCSGPCTLRLMPGHYHWALARSDGTIVPVPGPSLINGPSALQAHYEDKSGLRTTGAVVGLAGAVGGIIMILESFSDERVCDDYSGYCYEHSRVNGPLFAGGIGVLLGSAIVSAVLVSQRDEARVSVTPLKLLSIGSSRELGYPTATLRAQPQGAGVAISF